MFHPAAVERGFVPRGDGSYTYWEDGSLRSDANKGISAIKYDTFLKPGKTTVRSVPVGVAYGFSTRTVDLDETDLPSVARGELNVLQSQIRAAIPRVNDTLTKYHLQDLNERIGMALDPK